MNWLAVVVNVIMTGITLGDRLYVRIHDCPCGEPGARLGRNSLGSWYVYCPYGCRRRGALADTRRRAKKNWNDEIKEQGE